MDRKWIEIYSDDKDTWPEHNQLCQVVAFSEVHEMKFVTNMDSNDFIQMDCGFFSETAGCIGVGKREYADYGQILWRPVQTS